VSRDEWIETKKNTKRKIIFLELSALLVRRRATGWESPRIGAHNYDRRRCGFAARNLAGDWMLIDR
jgi:hypothetical protein